MNRVEFIRDEEKKYHDFCYDNYKLFEEGSWLYKPVNSVMEALKLFEHKKNLSVLDLGAGVGRNSIPIAQAIKDYDGKVVCVDLLDSAIEKLKHYSEEFNVQDVIETEKNDLDNYRIQQNSFDLIVAVSSLEHMRSEKSLDRMLQEMSKGTKKNGVNCIIINSEVEETDAETGEKLDALMEINISTEQMFDKLNDVYSGWKVIKQLVKPLEYNIKRNDKSVLLKTNAITYVVQKVET